MYFDPKNLSSPISPETAVISWLINIQCLSKDGSIESRKAVLELAEEEFPDFDSLTEELRNAVNKVKEIARSEDWKRSLSPNTSNLISSKRQNFTQKPDCAKKLDFF